MKILFLTTLSEDLFCLKTHLPNHRLFFSLINITLLKYFMDFVILLIFIESPGSKAIRLGNKYVFLYVILIKQNQLVGYLMLNVKMFLLVRIMYWSKTTKSFLMVV